MKLMIADDHEISAAGTVQLLWQTWPDIAMATTIDETLHKLATQTIDLLIQDVEFPEPHRTGFDVLRHCTRNLPSVKVIILTVWADPWVVNAARKDGARACLGKGDEPPLLVQVIHTVLAGGEYWQENEAGKEMPLTDKQLAVFRGLADGLTHGAIAARLGCAEVTVDAHLKQIKKRLNVGSMAEALVKGTAQGLLLRIGPDGSYWTGGVDRDRLTASSADDSPPLGQLFSVPARGRSCASSPAASVRNACQRSQPCWSPSQKSALMQATWARRRAVSGVTPRRALITSLSRANDTPNCSAMADYGIPSGLRNTASRISPGRVGGRGGGVGGRDGGGEAGRDVHYHELPDG